MHTFSELLPGHMPHARAMEQVAGTCPEHGNFVTWRLVGSDASTCPRCFAAALRRETQETFFRDRVARLQSMSGVPARYGGAGFSNFEQPTQAHRQAVGILTGYMRQIRDDARQAQAWRPIVMHGGVGTGKTHLVCALVNNLVSRGVSARYTTMQAMLADIRRAYGATDLTEAGQVDRYVNGPDLLVLDEADLIRGTDNDLGLVFAVVNGRYNASRPMVMVSNQPPDGLATYIGERTMSRMRENVALVSCPWPDCRGKNGILTLPS